MGFVWTDEKVRYMRAAAEQTAYYKEVAALIAEGLTGREHVCVAGCGLGDLAAALAPCAAQVTAVDVSARALAALKEKQIGNVSVRCGDIEALPPEQPYDVMAFCHFGTMEEILRIAARQCSGTVFLCKRLESESAFSRGKHDANHGFSYACEFLRARNIPFTGGVLETEFGQPFVSREDAARFFALYGYDAQTQLEETGNHAYPLYLPRVRRAGWLRFSASDIKENLV